MVESVVLVAKRIASGIYLKLLRYLFT